MSKTIVVNIRFSGYDEYIGRAGKGKDGYFGNPFPLIQGQPRGSTLVAYKAYFDERINSDPEFKRRVLELKGKRLGCFCKPAACHGDVIADYLNNL
jgi:hypothetical protein